MPRYYYTDPLKAAWMSYVFDVQYVNSENDITYVKIDAEFHGEGCLSYSDWGSYDVDDKYWIHPDCHEMLKPQVGDLIEYSKGKTEYIAAEDKLHHEASQDGFITLTRFNEWWGDYNPHDLAPIIQRNGIAFFMPEVEDA